MPDVDGRYMTQYELYIRRRDRVMRLVEKGTHKPVPMEACLASSKSDGVFVRPYAATGVYLMSDEVHFVSELPEMGK